MRAVKLFIDGAMGSRGAALLADYSDDPGNRGETYPAVEERSDRHFVGRIEHNRHRSAGFCRFPGKTQTREARLVGRIKLKPRGRSEFKSFGAGFDPDQVQLETWGSLELELACDSGIARFTPTEAGFPDGTLNLTRLTFLRGLSCPP